MFFLWDSDLVTLSRRLYYHRTSGRDSCKTDPLVSTEHGVMAAVIIALNTGIRMLEVHLRKRKRNGSLKTEVSTVCADIVPGEVQAEMMRIAALRAPQDYEAISRRDESMRELGRQIGELGVGQGKVLKQVELMHADFIDYIATVKPSYLKHLRSRTPVL